MSIIRNRKEIATTELREKALDIIEAGISRVLPSMLMKSAVSFDSEKKILTIHNNVYDASKGRIFVIGGGKAVGLMAEALEDIIGSENITDGVLNCKGDNYKTKKIKVIKASHPFPDEKGVEGVKEMLSLKNRYSINENDLIICLISGGGSALMPCPVEGVNLGDKQAITKLLVHSGIKIDEVNTVRKHLSRTKGGRLGQFFEPVKIVSLIISDVVGNNLNVIASSPTVPDISTFQDAYEVLEKNNLLAEAPKSVVEFLKKGCNKEVGETPEQLFNCYNYIIGDTELALEAMAERSKELGFNPFIITDKQIGDTTIMARDRANEIIQGEYNDYDVVLIGGETTPRLPKNFGKGGRNQHYAAVSLPLMEKYSGEWLIASVNTDGSDFLQDIAGAIVDKDSLNQVKEKNIDIDSYLEKYDSYNLLDKIGNSIIITGETGTNVSDVILYILKN